MPRSSTADVGDVIGGYELLRELARGGMAEVWVARKASSATSKFVAMKLVLPQFAGDERYSRMFRSEAETAAPLSHSNIVTVLDEGEDDGRSFLVMEWVDGVDLARLAPDLEALGARDDALRLRVIAYVIGQLLHGLSYAHRVTNTRGDAIGIVHRDVSPQNVLVSVSGDVKLTDFGVAHRMIEETSGLHVKGKLRYMPREQVAGQSKEPTVDLYAAGAVLHELLDGKKFRHQAEDQMQLYNLVMSGEVPPLSREVPPELDAVRVALLQPDPKKRPQTADAAILLLKKWPGYGEMKVELGQICGLMTGIVRPRTGPRFGGETVQREMPVGSVVSTTSGRRIPLRSDAGGTAAREADAPSFRHRESIADSAADDPAGSGSDDAATTLRDRAKSELTTQLVESGELQALVAEAEPGEATSTSTGRRAELAATLSSGHDSSQVGIERPEPVAALRVQPRRGPGIVLAAAAVLVGGLASVMVLGDLGGGDEPVASVDRPEPPAEAAPAESAPAEPEPVADPIHARAAPAKIEREPEPEPEPDLEIVDEAEPEPAVTKPAATPKPAAAKPKPEPAVGPPVTVQFRVDDDVGKAWVRLGKREIAIIGRNTAKIASGRQPVKWRTDPAASWRSAGSFDFTEGDEFVVKVSASGPTLKKM